MTVTTPRHRQAPAPLLRSGFGLAGFAIALGSALVLLMAPSVVAAGATVDGSDWDSTGVLASDSAVTVRWDNAGNPASSLVYRDSRQSLPHSGGKTYLDVAQSVNDDYYNYF